MKTKLFAIATVLFIGLGLTNSTFAATTIDNNATVLTDVSRISKIEVRGNVQLYVSAGNADQVKVYNRYYAESALVQNVKGVLRITSYKAEKLVVWVTANDLRDITAYDNAEVKTFGKLSAIDLEVNLYNNATANLNVDTYATRVNVNDHAKIDLAGTATDYTLNHNREAFVNNNNFTAVNYSDTLNNKATAGKKENNELAGL